MQKIIFYFLSIFLLPSAFAQIDRSKPPKPGPAPVISIPDAVTYRLSNGITVLVVENHKLPKVTASYYIDAGLITEGKNAGMMNLMGQMLNEGTKKHSKAAFDEAVDLLGADVSLNFSGGSASALTRYFDSAFFLMAEAIQEPAFDTASFSKIKSQTLTALKADERNVKAVARRVNAALLYGVNHPKGEFQTEATISNLTLNTIQQAYTKYITPSRGYLTFVGDIKPEYARQLADKAFAAWKGSALNIEKVPFVKNPSKTEVNLVDMPNAVQSEITVANLVYLPLNSSDYFPVLLANQILGGGAESRLFVNLREKHGYTYGAYSNIGTGRFQSNFSAYASVRNEKTDSAVIEFMKELKRLSSEKILSEELQQAKAVYNGNFAMSLENPARIASFARDILINQLPKDFYRTYLQKINAVSAEQVQRAARKYMVSDSARIIVTGKLNEIKDGMSKLGYPVSFFDKYAKPIQPASTAKVDTSVNPKNIIANYITSIGGQAALDTLKSVWNTYNINVNGMSLTAELKALAPNKQLMLITMGENVISKSLFDGTKGYQIQMGTQTDMNEKDILDQKSFTHLVQQIDYITNSSIKLQLGGIQTLHDTPAYKIMVTLPSGKIKTEYYNTKTGFLMKDEEEINANGITILKIQEYEQYLPVGTIKTPSKITVTVSGAGQEQTVEMLLHTAKLNEGVLPKDFE